MKIQSVWNVLLAGVLLVCHTVAIAGSKADYLLTNAKAYTFDGDQPWAEAVAFSGNKIVYVGDADGSKAYVGDETEIIDLEGKMLLPGFISGHDHLIANTWTNSGVNLNAAKSKEETFAMLKQYVKDNPDLEMVVGQGYNANIMGGYPTAKELDAIIPDKIAIILDYTIHDAWLNTLAMEAGEITKNTPDAVPEVTYWVRDEAGNPTGVGVELAWFDTYAKVAWNPEVMIAESREALHDIGTRGGFTTVLTPGLVTPNFANTDGMFADLETAMAMLTELDKQGELNIRSFVQPAYKDPNTDPEAFAKRSREIADRYDGDRVKVFGIKIHPEGTWSSGGVLMAEPWEGTEDYGASATSPERIKEVVLAANAQGLDVITHVEGSATVRGKIDAILASRAAGNKDERNALHHFMIVTPQDLQRTIENQIPVNVTPIFSTDWSSQDKDYLRMLGEKRTNEQVNQIAPLANGGVRLSISADTPSSPQDNIAALMQIYSAVTLKDPFAPATSSPFPPKASPLTLEQALEALTVNPAWQLRMEDKIGSLEVGKYADMVVLDKNLFDIEDLDEILEAKVQATIMDGKFRFRDGI